IVEAATHGNANKLSTAEEVLLLDRSLENETIATGGITRTDAERTCRLIFHIDDHHNPVGCGTLHGGDVDAGEVAESLETALGPRDHLLVEGIAFTKIELAADDVVARTGVAAHLDPLDIGALALVDEVGNAHRLVFEIAVAAGRHACKGIAGSSDTAGDFLHRPLHIAGIVGITGVGLHETAQIL